jgi:hypothetical protein
VIDGGDVTPNDNGVDPLLVEVDGCEALEASEVVPKEAVYPEQANHAVVAKHLEHIAPTLVVITISGSELLQALLLPLQDLSDHGLLDQRLEVVEDSVHIPRLRIILFGSEKTIMQDLWPFYRQQSIHLWRRDYLVELLELVQLVLGLVLELGAVLAEALELVHELVDHVPEPLVGQLHVDDAVEDDAEEVAVVGPGLGAVRGGERREARVRVAVPELPVEEEEDVVAVAVGRHGRGGRPRGVAEEAVGEALEAALVHLVDLVDILVADVAVEVHDEGLDGVRDVVGVVGVHRTGGVRGRRAVLPVVEGRHGGRGKGVRVRRGGVFF